MEKRRLRVIFTEGGSGSVTTKVTLPKKWIDEMGISKALREIEVSFDGERIIIERFKDYDEKSLDGMKWGDLSETQKTELLSNATIFNDETFLNYPGGYGTANFGGAGIVHNKTDDCIIDLTEKLSVAGRVVNDEIIVYNEAIIYNPSK